MGSCYGYCCCAHQGYATGVCTNCTARSTRCQAIIGYTYICASANACITVIAPSAATQSPHLRDCAHAPTSALAPASDASTPPAPSSCSGALPPPSSSRLQVSAQSRRCHPRLRRLHALLDLRSLRLLRSIRALQRLQRGGAALPRFDLPALRALRLPHTYAAFGGFRCSGISGIRQSSGVRISFVTPELRLMLAATYQRITAQNRRRNRPSTSLFFLPRKKIYSCAVQQGLTPLLLLRRE